MELQRAKLTIMLAQQTTHSDIVNLSRLVYTKHEWQEGSDKHKEHSLAYNFIMYSMLYTGVKKSPELKVREMVGLV